MRLQPVPVGSAAGGPVPAGSASVPVGSLVVGPPSWRDATLRSVRRAERLVRQSRAGRSAARSPDRSCSAAGSSPQSTAGGGGTITRLQSTGTTLPADARGRGVSGGRLPAPGLRERCAALSSSVAAGYMRGVREVEARLRRQAGRVSEEGVRLQRERGHLERMLRSVRTQRGVNGRSSAWRRRRGGRPASAETDRDVADELLLWESRELSGLEEHLKGALSDTQTQLQALGLSGQQLLDCASERARVLELLPPRGSSRPPGDPAGAPDPLGPFTPGCERVLEASSRTVGQSRRLRGDLRRLLGDAAARQDAARRSVNDSLVKKIAETTDLQQTLSVTSAATRQAVFRKQREVDFIRNSHGRAQGPESSADLLSREKLTRPLVQVYHRHARTQLPEASHLTQGCAALRRQLRTSQGDVERLQRAGSALLADLHRKMAAAQVDAAVLRMRRQQVDRRAVPSFLQGGGAVKSTLLPPGGGAL